MRDSVYDDFVRNGALSRDPLMEKYRWQISAYMLALGMPLILIGYKKSTGDIHMVTLTEPPYDIELITERIMMAEEYIASNTIPEGCTDYPCAFAYLHAPKELTHQVKVNEDLDGVMAAWASIDKEIKSLEKERAVLRTELLEQCLGQLGEWGPIRVKGPNSGVTVSQYWTEPGEYTVKKKGGWTVRVEGPKHA